MNAPDPGWPTSEQVKAAARAMTMGFNFPGNSVDMARACLSAVSPPRTEGPAREAIARALYEHERIKRPEKYPPWGIAVNIADPFFSRADAVLALMERTED